MTSLPTSSPRLPGKLGAVTVTPATLTGIGVVPGEAGLIASNCWPGAEINLKVGTEETVDVPNMAVTLVLAVTVTVHWVGVPPTGVHPLQLVNPAALAVKVTIVPLLRGVEVHVAPQLIKPTFDVTVPVPTPAGITVSVGLLKLAVTVVLAINVN